LEDAGRGAREVQDLSSRPRVLNEEELCTLITRGLLQPHPEFGWDREPGEGSATRVSTCHGCEQPSLVLGGWIADLHRDCGEQAGIVLVRHTSDHR
jgi:hypothetical protein